MSWSLNHESWKRKVGIKSKQIICYVTYQFSEQSSTHMGRFKIQIENLNITQSLAHVSRWYRGIGRSGVILIYLMVCGNRKYSADRPPGLLAHEK